LTFVLILVLVICLFGFIFHSDSQIWTLSERDFERKMEILMQKHFYSNAISMATQMKYSADDIAVIYHQYGDHLYKYGID
jgi:hypothetical protein